MADYFAVLQRTLSGFTDPKPELRVKLYERARSTIERQLSGRNPPVVGDALVLEMNRLEQAIVDIEQQYAPVPSAEESATQPEPAPAAIIETPVEVVAEIPEPVPVELTPEVVAPAPAVELAVEPVTIPEPEIPAAPPIVEEVSEPVPVTLKPEPAPPVQEPIETLAPPPIPVFDPPAPEPVVELQPVEEPDQIPDLALDIPTLPISTPQPPVVDEQPVAAPALEVEPVAPVPAPTEQPAETVKPAESAVDPVEEWAKEFLSYEPGQNAAPQPAQVNAEAVSPVSEPTVAVTPELQVSEPTAHMVPQAPEAQSTVAIPAAHELPAFDPVADENLGIPPAAGFSPRKPRRTKKRGGLKWLILLILLGGIAVAGYFGWQSRTTIVDTLGLNSWFVDPQDPQTPKKVKTITIKPDPVEPAENPAKATPVKPKAETRIPANDTATSAEKTEIKPVPANATPPVAQSAVLYEEGGTAADSSIDQGRVLWSVVQESPLEGMPAEPVIRGRIEVPSRKLVLNMTIKRNADKSLPASHVIQLNFTVPKDFSGGSIGQIRSLVFKGSEQGQGKALIGVPVQITDGQFILALNNLESAQKTNIGLMKSSGWIDVPMLYRTGRRAFITIEKGVPGEKIFQEVIAAWGQ